MEKVKILVVDDESLPTEMVIEQLREAPYEIDSDTRGEHALERLKTNPDTYKLVLVDRMMFGMDGMGLLAAMKSDPKLKDIPFIMQTGEAEQEEIDAALEAGATEVIFKPIKKTVLLEVLQRYV